ncbi:hypothetical protein TURU_166728 [Turdus rufiventris]|nr:hypothetical protein TURU_166728 [Turdus rufiventris]
MHTLVEKLSFRITCVKREKIFADYKLGGSVDLLDSKAEEGSGWAGTRANYMRLKKVKILPLGLKNPVQCSRLQKEWLESCPGEKNLGLTAAEHEPAVNKWPRRPRGTVASRVMAVIVLLH